VARQLIQLESRQGTREQDEQDDRQDERDNRLRLAEAAAEGQRVGADPIRAATFVLEPAVLARAPLRIMVAMAMPSLAANPERRSASG
jgi:hypothetical protein